MPYARSNGGGLFSKITTAARCLVFLKLGMLPPWGEGGGGGGGQQQALCLVAKQAVEFPQVLASFQGQI